jgi:hypothetical protein
MLKEETGTSFAIIKPPLYKNAPSVYNEHMKILIVSYTIQTLVTAIPVLVLFRLVYTPLHELGHYLTLLKYGAKPSDLTYCPIPSNGFTDSKLFDTLLEKQNLRAIQDIAMGAAYTQLIPIIIANIYAYIAQYTENSLPVKSSPAVVAGIICVLYIRAIRAHKKDPLKKRSDLTWVDTPDQFVHTPKTQAPRLCYAVWIAAIMVTVAVIIKIPDINTYIAWSLNTLQLHSGGVVVIDYGLRAFNILLSALIAINLAQVNTYAKYRYK